MALETVAGNLLAYKELEPDTFQHVDQVTTGRRIDFGLRNKWFYTADGQLYTAQKNRPLWAITREPQNVVLRDIDEAYGQLRSQGNYFPGVEAGRASFGHEDTVVVDLRELGLVAGSGGEYGHFVIDPRAANNLSSEQRRAAQRIYGPDEDNFGLNMEMFAEAGITPCVFVLMPEYVQVALGNNGKEFLGRASWLGYFSDYSGFVASGRDVVVYVALRGVRRVVREADAPQNQGPQALQETGLSPTMEEILAVSRPHVPDFGWKQFRGEIGKLNKR
jgi:hypothetical protein